MERLLAEAPAPGRFNESELAQLPLPARRHLLSAIEPGTPIYRSAHIKMRGSIRLGDRWLPFRARQTLTPHRGFVWAARVGQVINGSDQYIDRHGWMHWKLAGIITVMHAAGPDVSRASAARGAAEAVWIPTTLLPRFGVEWNATDDTHITARYTHDGTVLNMRHTLHPDGRTDRATFDRWGDPDNTGTYGFHPFGIDVTAHTTFSGLTIPSAGRLGWFHGTQRWHEGEFFRYDITSLEPVR